MADIKEHIASSIENIRIKHPEIYTERQEILERLVVEMHMWLDWFFGKKGDNYDYTGFDVMKHREKRHHSQGINLGVREFSGKYGEELVGIIREELERHVVEDMGYVPSEEDYKRIGFWKELRGF
jgi:hypothetical protein